MAQQSTRTVVMAARMPEYMRDGIRILALERHMSMQEYVKQLFAQALIENGREVLADDR